tara:strand:+ start:33 stop:458 length:426 start_codon:yes stop_codon:yes gene_type:complete
MANRMFNRVQALDKEVKFLFLTATIGAGGDPTLVENKSVGIKSISDTDPGEYDITLGTVGGDTDKYPALLFASCEILDGTHIGTNGGMATQIEVDDITNGIIKLFCIDKSGAVADPRNGSTLKIMIVVKNSNVAGVGLGAI